MTVLDVAEVLGVKDRKIRSDLDLVEAVAQGLPLTAVEAVVHSGILSAQEAERLVIPRRTLAHRRQKGQHLTPEESDRLARVVTVNAIANEQFGDSAKASRWLRKPNRALEGRIPLDLLSTGAGARLVEETILRIAHGIFF